MPLWLHAGKIKDSEFIGKTSLTNEEVSCFGLELWSLFVVFGSPPAG